MTAIFGAFAGALLVCRALEIPLHSKGAARRKDQIMEFVERWGDVPEEARGGRLVSVATGLALSLLVSPGVLSCAGAEGLEDETLAALPDARGSSAQSTGSAELGLAAESARSSARGACAGDPGIAFVGFREARGVAEVKFEPRPGVLSLALGLEDAAISARVGEYDGSSERAFACVPLRTGPYGEIRNQRIELPWAESIEHDGRRFDVHRTAVQVTDTFATHLWTYNRGVYFGLETARGIVWAQWPGEDLLVRDIGNGSPTLRPVPGPVRGPR